MIDKASVFAERFKSNPQVLQATVLGQGPDPNLDPYTALRALQLIKESNAMQMAQQAQGPTSAPSLASQAVAPQGLAGMLPMGAPAGQMPQGQAPQQMAQAPDMQASGGLAGLPTSEEDYAEGGIVAFQAGGLNTGDPEALAASDDATRRIGTDGEVEPAGEGNAGLQARAFEDTQETRNLIKRLTRGTTTPEEDDAAVAAYMRQVEKFGGPDIYKPAFGKLDEREAGRAKTSRQGQGLALLAAAGAILEGNTLARGAAKAFPVFAKEMGEVQRADIAEQRSIENMRFALADAQRKERMGDIRGAQAAREAARKDKADAAKFELDKAKALADLDAKALAATRPRTGAGAGGPKLAEQLYADNVANMMATSRPKPGESEKAFEARIRAEAGKLTAQQTKTSFSTSDVAPEKARVTTAPVQQRIDQDVAAAMNKFTNLNPAYRRAVREGRDADAKALYDAEAAKQRKIFEASESAVSGGGGSARSPRGGTMPPPPPAGFTPDKR